MGAGGVLVPPAGYFEKVQAVLRRHDILFVADEVICGFGRTGNYWGCNTYDIRPDLLTCAKQLSSAYQPIGAVLITDQVYDAIKQQSAKLGVFGTGHTYGGHPVAAAVALETLKIYEEDDVFGHVRAIAPHFQARVQALANQPLVGDARGVGLIAGLEIVEDKASKGQYPAETKAAPKIVAEAMERGLLLRPLPGDGIGICPPLIITDSQIDDLFDRLEAAFAAATPMLRAA